MVPWIKKKLTPPTLRWRWLPVGIQKVVAAGPKTSIREESYQSK